jgi:hypothetical protein
MRKRWKEGTCGVRDRVRLPTAALNAQKSDKVILFAILACRADCDEPLKV